MKTTKSRAMTIRKNIITAALTAGLLISVIGLVMQPYSAEARGFFGIKQSPGQIVDRLTERLDLTAEQVLAIQPIIEEKVEKMNEIQVRRGADRQAARAAMQKLRWDTQIKLHEILTEEQIVKYLEFRQEQRAADFRGKFGGSRMARGFDQTPEQVIERMTYRFNLSEEQAAAIEPIIAESIEKKRAVFDRYGYNRFDMRQEMRNEMQAIGDTTEEELAAILTDEQMVDLRSFRDQKRDRRNTRMNCPGPGRF